MVLSLSPGNPNKIYSYICIVLLLRWNQLLSATAFPEIFITYTVNYEICNCVYSITIGSIFSMILCWCFSHLLQGSVLCSILYWNDCNLVSHVEINGIVKRVFQNLSSFVFQTSVHILPSEDCFGHMIHIIN